MPLFPSFIQKNRRLTDKTKLEIKLSVLSASQLDFCYHEIKLGEYTISHVDQITHILGQEKLKLVCGEYRKL